MAPDAGVRLRLRLLKKGIKRDWTLRLMRTLVAPGQVTVDIGANRGVYTLALSRRWGLPAKVHAIDPVSAQREKSGAAPVHDTTSECTP